MFSNKQIALLAAALINGKTMAAPSGQSYSTPTIDKTSARDVTSDADTFLRWLGPDDIIVTNNLEGGTSTYREKGLD